MGKVIFQKMSDGTVRRKITDKEVVYNESPKIDVRVEKKKFGPAGKMAYSVYINNAHVESFTYSVDDEKAEKKANKEALTMAKSLKAKINPKSIISKLR